MSVSIKEIHIQNLGPHKQFFAQFGRLNLVFGQNENGKTYLVEFIIRSLFKQAGVWGLRSQKGKGKVVVNGLSNGQSTDFSPTSPRKIEDYWDKEKMGLPSDFSRLLVVKGAEVEISDIEGGIDKTLMKRLFSGKNILEQIEGRISKTIQKTRLESNRPVGPKTGEIKERSNLENLLAKYDELLSQVDTEYSGGRRVLLLERKKVLQKKVDEMILAKQHLAYKIDQDIQKLKRDLNRISSEKLHEARGHLTLFRQKELECKQKMQEQQEAELRSEHYEWLKNTAELYQSLLKKESTSPKPYFLILSLLSICATAVLIFLNLNLYAGLSLFGVLIFGFLHFYQYRRFLSLAAKNTEIEKLKKAFKEKFNADLSSLPQILALLKEQEENHNTSRILKKQLEEDLSRQEILKLTISDLIFELAGERKDQRVWDDVLRLLQNEIQKKQAAKGEREIDLARLGIDPSDYRTLGSNINFSKSKLDKLESELKETDRQIQVEEEKLTSLKQRICDQTGDDMTSSWEQVIEHLREKREQVLQSYKSKTAEIIGKLAVLEVIEELKQDEESKLLAGLKSKEVQEPLFQMTKRYKSVDFENDTLVVSDSFDDFPVSELSTGAREQILLALRIGFATKIARQKNLFMILDDAFQYSDWQRRKFLLEKTVLLAKSGWQIIYFTMDDHIRQLFDEAGKAFGEEYKFIELQP